MSRYDDVNGPAALEAGVVGGVAFTVYWIVISALSDGLPILGYEITGLGRYSGSLSAYMISALTVGTVLLWLWYRRDHYNLVNK